MGLRSQVSRNTLANANSRRDWRIYADFAQALIRIARPLYVDDDFGLELQHTVYALDSSTIDLCLSVFPWARFKQGKAAVKLHTLLDLRGPIPSFIHVSDGKLHDVNLLDMLSPEPGAFYVFDRAYLDFQRLFRLQQASAFFVTRQRKDLKFTRRYSHPVDKASGLRCDQTIVLSGTFTPQYYPLPLRRVKLYDAHNNKTFNFLTNNFDLPALTITELYRCRWHIEVFFKWIKQHLRIKAFFGHSQNAVNTQIWIAISIYVLVAIVKKRLHIPLSLYTILQILSLTLFEKMPLYEVLTNHDYKTQTNLETNQLNLFT